MLVAQQVAQQRGERPGGGHLAPARALLQVPERPVARQRQGAAVPHHPAGHGSVEGPSAVHHVAELHRVGRRPVVGRDPVGEVLLVDLVLHVQPRPQLHQLLGGHLLDLVGGVAALEALAQGPSLDGLGQDHGGLVLDLVGGLEGGVHLLVVVAPPGQDPQLLVGQVVDELAQSGVGAEEVLPDVGAGLHRVALVLAVDGGRHLVEQRPVGVAHQQVVPLGAPNHLDHVPARAPEHALELLDDLAVAPHRPVEALEVAVDHPLEVVEPLAAGQRDGAQGLGLVALAVAQEAPHRAVGGVVDAAVVDVAVEAGVVDGVDRAEPHRHGRVLPEVGHQPGVGVA